MEGNNITLILIINFHFFLLLFNIYGYSYSVNGKSYFVCPPKYGGFVTPLAVEVGDFPAEDIKLDDEI